MNKNAARGSYDPSVPAFDEHGQAEAVDYNDPATLAMAAEEGEEDARDLRHLGEEITLNLLRLLTARGVTPYEAGQRAFLLLYCMRKGDFKNRAAFAKRIGVSRGRVSQLLNTKSRSKSKTGKGFNTLPSFAAKHGAD